MKYITQLLCAVFFMSTMAFAQATTGPMPLNGVPVVNTVERADAATNVQHTHTLGGSATITLTAGAAGTATQSIYITGIDISNCESTAAVTPATPTWITTTGINGAPQYMLGTGPAAAGTCSPTSVIAFTAPLKSQTPGTNVTFTIPGAATNQFISLNVYYRLGY